MNILKHLEETRNLSKLELAKILDISKSNYSDLYRELENNTTILSIKKALKIHEHFGISLEEIYGITKEEQEQGLGNHPTTLSKEEWEWLELGSEALRIKGADYYQSLKTMIKAVINNP